MTEQYRQPDGQINVYNEILTKTQRQHRLLSVQWEVTYRCNERCTHCYLDVLPPSAQVPGELSTEEGKRIIDELAGMGALTITFSGGEVFLRRDIFELSHYARKRGFAIRYFTNGILIKDSVADKIADVKPVVVELSVYGSNADTHDAITQVPGSFNLTMRAIQLLLERNVRCIMKTPIMKENIEQVGEMEALAQNLGISFQYDLTIIPKHTGDVAPLKHRPSDEQLLTFLEERVTPETWAMHAQSGEFRFCGIGMNSLNIGPTGDVQTCLGARVTAGNL